MEEKTNYLAHHGIKGQRWGIRRYQNADGSLTEEGRKKLGRLERKQARLENKTRKKQKRHLAFQSKIAELQSEKAEYEQEVNRLMSEIADLKLQDSRIVDKGRKYIRKIDKTKAKIVRLS